MRIGHDRTEQDSTLQDRIGQDRGQDKMRQYSTGQDGGQGRGQENTKQYNTGQDGG